MTETAFDLKKRSESSPNAIHRIGGLFVAPKMWFLFAVDWNCWRKRTYLYV